MKVLKVIVFVIISSLVIGNSSLAYRPFGTEDAGVAGQGVAQFEASWDNLKWSSGDTENVFLFVPIYGVTDRLELSCEVPYMFHNFRDGTAHRGVGDANVVAKYLLLEEGGNLPASTSKGVVKLDSGNSDIGLGSGDKDVSTLAVFSKNIGLLACHAHVGYTFIGKSKNSTFRDIALYGLAFDYALTEVFHLAAEINGNRHPDSTSIEDPRNWLIGFLYKTSDRIILDGALKRGLTGASPDTNIAFGASITL